MNHKKIICIGLITVLSFSSVLSSFGGEPVMRADEALYVTLDAYGQAVETNVVKSYSVNGAKTIIDYGSYDKITNMTDYTEPKVKNGTVTFTFQQEQPDRFYFQGKMSNDAVTLPWKIDVGYKLNGVEKRAEELAGQSGLIQIDIDVTPNENASEYYKNNMILQAAAVVNADEVLSVEAPGAQVQAFGSMKTILFFALPGEEQHFTMRIGSNDFEFSGLVFLMTPATLQQLDDIADLREAKEDIEDSADAMSDSMDIVLDTMSAMQEGFGQTKEGLQSLEEAREKISSSKDDIYNKADDSLDNLAELSEKLKPFDAHLTIAQEALHDINQNSNSMIKAMDQLRDQLNTTKSVSVKIQDDLEEIQDFIDTARADKDSWIDVLTRLKEDLGDFDEQTEQLLTYIHGLELACQNLATGLDNLSDSGISSVMSGLYYDYVNNDNIQSLGLYATLQAIENAFQLTSEMKDVSNATANIAGTIYDMYYDSDGNKKEGENTLSLGNISDDIKEIIDLSQSAINNADSHADAAKSLIDQTGTFMGVIAESSDEIQNLMDSVDELQETINKYHEEMVTTVEDSRQTINTASEGIEKVHDFFSSLEGTMRDSGKDLDQGTKDSIAGLIDVLQHSLEGLGETDTIKNAKDTIKDLVDDKWDEYTGEKNNILNMDSEAEMISFTSDQNPSPQSLQVIMRTTEISLDDGEDSPPNKDEDFHAEGNIFSRICNIFKKLWDTLYSIFQ